MTQAAFNKFAANLAALNGLSADLAETYAARIGDTPELDDDGLVVVRGADQQVMARLRLE